MTFANPAVARDLYEENVTIAEVKVRCFKPRPKMKNEDKRENGGSGWQGPYNGSIGWWRQYGLGWIWRQDMGMGGSEIEAETVGMGGFGGRNASI